MSDFMEFAQTESAALRPTLWDVWLDAVETCVGHDLDGDQEKDGYSLDTLQLWFAGGLSSASAADRVRHATT